MDMLNMADNILRAYVLASDSDISEGMAWYDDALGLAAELSPNDIARGAGVIAALSPLTSWPLNVRRAREVFATGTTSGMGNNVRKAERIFAGESPESVLSGPKVTSFFHNIMGNDEMVTVDRHAIDVAYGRVMSDDERSKAVSGKRYGILKDAYSHVANILSTEMEKVITGAQLQAAVWVYWRANHAAAFHA
jgi:hypothetical protein